MLETDIMQAMLLKDQWTLLIEAVVECQVETMETVQQIHRKAPIAPQQLAHRLA